MKGNLIRTYLVVLLALTAVSAALARRVETGKTAGTAVGVDSARAMTVKDGVFEFDIASLHVSETDVLADILYLLPGMDVSRDGIITMNDKTISGISLDGKSIIKGNPQVVAKSIPVRWIKKIRVRGGSQIDLETDSRYRERLQAFASVEGGYGAVRTNDREGAPGSKFLYGGNVVVSGQGKKEDFIIVGNAGNISGAPSEETDVMTLQDGLSTFDIYDGMENDASVGASITTKRVKDVAIQADIVYRHSGRDIVLDSRKETFGSEGKNLLTKSIMEGTGTNDLLRADLSISGKLAENTSYSLSPYLSHQKTGYESYASLLNTVGGDTLGATSTVQEQDTRELSAGVSAGVSMVHLGGNTGRSLAMSVSASMSDTKQDNRTSRQYDIPHSPYPYVTTYNRETDAKILSAGIAYVEPLAERWSLTVDLGANLRRSTLDDDATFLIYSIRPDNKNARAVHAATVDKEPTDEKITNGTNDNLTLTGKALAKYSGKAHKLSAGISFSGIENKVDIGSREVIQTTDKDKWHLKLSPTLAYQFNADDIQLSADYSVSGVSPAATLLSPGISFDLLGAVATGNIYLRPTHSHQANIKATYNNTKSLTTININALATIVKSPVVMAYWFDEANIQYAFPVNSEKPKSTIGGSLTVDQPLGKGSPFSVSLTANISYVRQSKYLNKSQMAGLDVGRFSYLDFIQDVWGGSDGERFYSGESGFALNEVKKLRYSFNASLNYDTERVGIVARVYTRKNTYEYSRMTSTYNNTWQHRFCLEGRYSLKSGLWAYSELRYLTFNGYPEGCGDPELRWNVWGQKKLGDFTLSLTAMDILDQAKNFRHAVTANDVENTFTNALGRHALIGLSYNFGK